MTATRTTPAPSSYLSGFCSRARHEHCRGTYPGAVCDCACHSAELEPEPVPEPPDFRIGSLFSGYGGLEQGVQAVLGGTVAWHSDIDPGVCKILAHRYPDVPNIGDITTVDWSAVEPVKVLTLGFPCQDVSCAGLRKGLRPGTRSGLWTHAAYAIDQLRPELVVIENVRGLLSAPAHSDLEPCPWCLGDDGLVPLRALGAVLGDLADLGFDAEWIGLPASDVGAPHERFRVFVIAWPADADSVGRFGWPRVGGPSGWGQSADSGSAALSHSTGVRRREGGSEPAWFVRRSDDVVGGSPTPADSHGVALREQSVALAGRRGAAVAGLAGAHPAAYADRHRVVGGEGGRQPVRADERLHADRCRPDAAADADCGGQRPDVNDLRAGESHTDWGAYGSAVQRWERLTRPAPAPTERGAKGGRRLSPAFVEWMQGLPAGWVTEVPGLTRNEQLKALGNGVVPQQAAQALRMLLPDVGEVAA